MIQVAEFDVFYVTTEDAKKLKCVKFVSELYIWVVKIKNK